MPKKRRTGRKNEKHKIYRLRLELRDGEEKRQINYKQSPASDTKPCQHPNQKGYYHLNSLHLISPHSIDIPEYIITAAKMTLSSVMLILLSRAAPTSPPVTAPRMYGEAAVMSADPLRA